MYTIEYLNSAIISCKYLRTDTCFDFKCILRFKNFMDQINSSTFQNWYKIDQTAIYPSTFCREIEKWVRHLPSLSEILYRKNDLININQIRYIILFLYCIVKMGEFGLQPRLLSRTHNFRSLIQKWSKSGYNVLSPPNTEYLDTIVNGWLFTGNIG